MGSRGVIKFIRLVEGTGNRPLLVMGVTQVRLSVAGISCAGAYVAVYTVYFEATGAVCPV